MSGHAKLALALQCHQNMRRQLAAVQGLRGALQCWKNLADGVDGSACPRQSLCGREARDAFVEVLVQETSQRWFPTATALFLEMLFQRQCLKCPLGLNAKEPHPFAEPRHMSSRRSESSSQARARVFSELDSALIRFRKWLCDERHFFYVRVIHWSASGIPSEFLTAKGLEGRDRIPKDIAEEAESTDKTALPDVFLEDEEEVVSMPNATASLGSLQKLSSVNGSTAHCMAQMSGNAEAGVADSESEGEDVADGSTEDVDSVSAMTLSEISRSSSLTCAWPTTEWKLTCMRRAIVA